MRVLILAALLLGSSSLCPSFAQEQGKPVPQEQAKPAVEAPQTAAPGRTDQNADQPRDQRTGRDQSRADDRVMGPDWRIRRGDDERFGRDRTEMGSEGRMRRDDREMGSEGRIRRDGERMGRDDRETGPDPRMQRDRDWDRGPGRGDRDRDYVDRDKDDRSYFDNDRPGRRVKICVEYENGDEYCRYRR